MLMRTSITTEKDPSLSGGIESVNNEQGMVSPGERDLRRGLWRMEMSEVGRGLAGGSRMGNRGGLRA